LIAKENPVDELADITITASSADWLAEFTHRLVKDGLVACGNIVPQVRSIYAWEGAIEDEQEALVILHTRRSLVPQIIERSIQEHPYDTPQILVLPVIDANPDYHTWVLNATATSDT
jgi:periplasmic divalent cation tolerance protein